MTARTTLAVLSLLSLSAILNAVPQTPQAPPESAGAATPAGEATEKVAQGVLESMSSEHMHMGAHMKWTSARPASAEDLERARQIVQTLRQAVEKYKDYHAALADNFKIFLPKIPQPLYHFTNYRYGLEAQTNFDPTHPTSLLYRKTADGYELVGAMYTATRFTSEDQLNERIPLSVARWHAHINICLPPRGQGGMPDLTRFGPTGSIATEAECNAAGGRFLEQIFGWMVHVYPYRESPEKIWGH